MFGVRWRQQQIKLGNRLCSQRPAPSCDASLGHTLMTAWALELDISKSDPVWGNSFGPFHWGEGRDWLQFRSAEWVPLRGVLEIRMGVSVDSNLWMPGADRGTEMDSARPGIFVLTRHWGINISRRHPYARGPRHLLGTVGLDSQFEMTKFASKCTTSTWIEPFASCLKDMSWIHSCILFMVYSEMFFCISGASTDLALTWEDLNFFSWALQPSPVVSTENHWRFRDAKSASSENPFSIAQACLFDICITCIIWKFVSLYRCITLKLKSTIR